MIKVLILSLFISLPAIAKQTSARDQSAFQNRLIAQFRLNCNSEETQQWFRRCIYRRPNCPIRPGSYCYGAAGAWGQCTGRRPPMQCR